MDQLVTFAIVAAALAVSPGPDTFLVLRNSVNGGAAIGIASALGISTGLLIWALGSAVGVTAILVASQDVFRAMQVAGAVFLIWLGVQSLRAARGRAARHHPDGATASKSPWLAYRTGLVTNLLNPKIGVFYLAVFPPFLPEGGNAFLWSSGLALLLIAEGLVWFGAIVLLASKARSVLRRPAVARMLEGISGLAMMLFGTRLLWASASGARDQATSSSPLSNDSSLVRMNAENV